MPVAYQMLFRNGTLDQYNQVIEKMGLAEGGDMPEGGMFHWVTQTDNGILVVDVWETEAHFEKFSEEQIGPISREVGLEGPPETTVHQVHNWLGG